MQQPRAPVNVESPSFCVSMPASYIALRTVLVTAVSAAVARAGALAGGTGGTGVCLTAPLAGGPYPAVPTTFVPLTLTLPKKFPKTFPAP